MPPTGKAGAPHADVALDVGAIGNLNTHLILFTLHSDYDYVLHPAGIRMLAQLSVRCRRSRRPTLGPRTSIRTVSSHRQLAPQPTSSSQHTSPAADHQVGIDIQAGNDRPPALRPHAKSGLSVVPTRCLFTTLTILRLLAEADIAALVTRLRHTHAPTLSQSIHLGNHIARSRVLGRKGNRRMVGGQGKE